jgi:hypothetical protein
MNDMKKSFLQVLTVPKLYDDLQTPLSFNAKTT